MRSVGLTIAALALAAVSVGAQTLDTSLYQLNILPNNYIVQYNDASGGGGGLDQFAAEMQAAGIPFTITKNFTLLLKGASIQVDDKHVDSMASFNNVNATWPLRLTSLSHDGAGGDKATPLPPLKMLAHDYTGVGRLRSEKKLTGKGVKIGIIDSGLDYKHRAFGGCFKTAGCRITHGYDFVGDQFDGHNTPVPDDDPMDTCNGHGTHVAGIAAGNDGVFQGVAPDATLGIYRVMGCNGLASTTVILEAMERAFADGMDILSISLGTPSGWSEYPESRMVSALYGFGKYVVTGVGNDGADTLWAVSSPASGAESIAVGAVDLPNFYSQSLNVTVGKTVTVVKRSGQQRDLAPLKLVNVPFVRAVATSGGDDYACGPINAAKGAVVLAQRGNCALQDKAVNALNAGAAALAIYNNESGDSGLVFYDQAINLPSFSILKVDGEALIAQLAKGSATASVDTRVSTFSNGKDGPTRAWYSSWGPSVNGDVKPDLLAPGTNIYSTLPTNQGEYGLQSGTSMATPYVSGTVALLIESKRAASVDSLYNLLFNTCTLLWNRPSRTESVALQGNGFLNAYNAVTTDFTVSRYYNVASKYVSDLSKLISKTMYFDNMGSKDMTYNFEFIPSLSVSAYDKDNVMVSPPRTSLVTLYARFMLDTITFKAGNTGTKNSVSFDTTPIRENDLMVHSGYVNMYPKAGTPGYNLTIPYLGYAFRQAAIPILAPSYSGINLPCLVQYGVGMPLKNGKVFTFTGNDYPTVIFRIQIPVYRVRVRIAKAATPTNIHATVTENHFLYLQKNMDSGDVQPYYTYVWDGVVYSYAQPSKLFNLASGQYVMLLEFYPTSSGDSPATYTTPMFEVKR
ncbi:hypothetical protein IWQ60_000060 [Tieghemiomyces parasiticus]|uniref:Subtilisin n=1 Tax=Tieghemiomyces parasiticus TaxID=78921 RepID=A0A9W8AMU6_9FUNG|nr:hypothetical protein IWQ60_000060 [Tieghemiomyces parasiticus]